MFAHVEVGAECRAQGICASLCPTGALRRRTEGHWTELVFDATGCINCRRCVTACPEGALSFAPSGGSVIPTVIGSHRLAVCVECEDEFTVQGQEDRCPACLKSKSLFAEVGIAPASRGALANKLERGARHDQA